MFDFGAAGVRVCVLKADTGEHVLMRDGGHAVQLVVRSGSVLDGPVRLSYQFGGRYRLELRLSTVQRLAGLWITGRLPAGPQIPRHRIERW